MQSYGEEKIRMSPTSWEGLILKSMSGAGISRYKLYGPFMFGKETVLSGPYLDILQHFFIHQLQQYNSMDIVFQQDGVPPHWANYVASKFSSPHPTRLFSLGFCEE